MYPSAFFIFFLWIPIILFAKGLPLPDVDGGSLSIVHNCVNVISGDYITSTCDISLPGAENLDFNRFYSSSDNEPEGLYGWRHNHLSNLCLVVPHDTNEFHLSYTNQDGREADYFGTWQGPLSITNLKYKETGPGFTNIGYGELSGRNQMKNNLIEYLPKSSLFLVKSSNGSKSHFVKKHYGSSTKEEDYQLLQEQKSNGNIFSYEYTYTVLTEIKAEDLSKKTCFSSLRFNYLPNKKLKKELRFELLANNGKKVIYELETSKGNNPKYYIKKVIKPDAPYEEYSYTPKTRLGQCLCKKELPDHRFIEIQYITGGKEFTWDRVGRLLAPVGFDNRAIPIYEFDYSKASSKDKTLEGATYVLDAKKHLSVYWYTKELRIDHIQKYKGTENHKLYSQEKFLWSDEGQLLCHYIEDENKSIQAARSFNYDEKGNLLIDRFYGNLRGGSSTITMHETKKRPHTYGCDCWTVNYKYSQDGRNLLLEEQAGHKTTKYTYDNDKDLLTSKLIFENGTIRVREFYDYDAFGLITCTTVDDGITPDRHNKKGITQRKFVRTINQTEIPIGFPKQIDEYYLDLKSGKEKLFKRVMNEYSIDGHLISRSVYDSQGIFRYSENFQYDAHGNIISEQNAVGDITLKSYNSNDELIFEKKIGAGYHKEYCYDYSGRLISTLEHYEDGVVLSACNEYDYLNNIVATIDPFGQKTKYSFDEFGRVTKTYFPVYTDPLNRSISKDISKEYDIFGNVTKTETEKGMISTKYNARGDPISITYKDGSGETFVYNDDGTLKRSLGRNGLVTEYTYDCFGRVLNKKNYFQGVVLSSLSSTYNSFQKLSETSHNGQTTYYSYTDSGLLKSISKGDSLTEYEYDELQRLYKTKEWTNKESYTLKIERFDLLNRVIEESIFNERGELLKNLQFTYDINGNKTELIEKSEAGVAITQTIYNSRNQPVKLIDAEGQETHFTYFYDHFNDHGEQVLQTIKEDSYGIQTITTMNIFGMPEKIELKNRYGQLIAKKEMGYDKMNHLVVAIEQAISGDKSLREVVTTWEYNKQNQLISLKEAVGAKEQKETRFYYNTFGEKYKTVKPDGCEIYQAFDLLGRLKSYSASDGSFSYTYEYDLNSNLVKSHDLVNNQVTSRMYDASDRMVSETLGNGLEVTYSYDRIGRPVKVTLPDHSFISYEYNPLQLKQVKRYSKEGIEQFSHEYCKYDLNGRLLQEKDENIDLSYKYDLKGRLRSIDSKIFSERITYDAHDNIISFEMLNTPQNIHGQFSYDDLDQLKSEKGLLSHTYVHDSLNNCIDKDNYEREVNELNQLLKTNSQEFKYDKNGNRIFDGIHTYIYDATDRLTSIVCDHEQYDYTYDSFNRRLAKIHKKSNEIVGKTFYLYLGQNEVGSYDDQKHVNEFRLLGTGKGAEIGATLLIEKENTSFVPIHDHNGNIISLIDTKSKETVESYRYSAFGEEKIFDQSNNEIKKSLVDNPWRFASKRVDEETGLIYFGRRHYDPTTATWMSPDPLGFEAGPNLYAYVMNNPLSHIDLYGLESVQTDVGGGIGKSTPAQPLTRERFSLNRFVSRGLQVVRGFFKDILFSSNGLPELLFKNQTHLITDSNKPRLPKATVIYVNGIRNSRNDALKSGSYISDTIDGYAVDVLCTPTKGFIGDTLECALGLLGLVNAERINVLHNYVHNYFKNAPEGAKCFIIAHSGGAILVRATMKYLPKEYRERIIYRAYSPATFMERGLCSSIAQYRSSRDFVPLFDVYGRITCNSTRKVLKPKSNSPLFDHDLESPTFRDIMKQNNRDFLINYGGI